MKRIIVFIATAIMAFAVIAGCAQEERTDTTDFLNESATSDQSEIAYVENEDGIPMYVITFKIKQSHISLDIKKHIKDAINELTLSVPVDKEYYNSVSVGDVINDDFRFGSLIMRGSFGNWRVTVGKKEIMYQSEKFS